MGLYDSAERRWCSGRSRPLRCRCVSSTQPLSFVSVTTVASRRGHRVRLKRFAPAWTGLAPVPRNCDSPKLEHPRLHTKNLSVVNVVPARQAAWRCLVSNARLAILTAVAANSQPVSNKNLILIIFLCNITLFLVVETAIIESIPTVLATTFSSKEPYSSP